MEGKRNSSKPPPGICMFTEDGGETANGRLLRPLAKIRLRSKHTLINSPAGNGNPYIPDNMSRLTAIKGADYQDEDELDGQTNPVRHESGERPVMSEDEARRSRRGIENTLLDVVPHIEEQLTRIYRPTDEEIRHYSDEEKAVSARLRNISDEDIEAKILLLSKWSRLYQEGTLEAHEKTASDLRKENHTAEQVYEIIHSDGDLELSNFEHLTPNEFAKRLVKSKKIKRGSIIFELGTGGGEDARLFAGNVRDVHVLGVDISDNAVNRANRISESRGQGSHVNIMQGNFLYILDKLLGQPISGIYSHSTLHYSPGMVLEQQIFPIIADVLRKKHGSLFLAMKIGKSESAHSPLQVELDPGNPDNPKIDFRSGGVFRIYPETQEDVHGLLRQSGLVVVESRIVPIIGYDRPGKIEYFVQLIAKAA